MTYEFDKMTLEQLIAVGGKLTNDKDKADYLHALHKLKEAATTKRDNAKADLMRRGRK